MLSVSTVWVSPGHRSRKVEEHVVSQHTPSTGLHPTHHPHRAAPAATANDRTSSVPDESLDAAPRLDGVRIAMINWRDPWQSVAGGAETYAWQISRYLVRCGAEVVFVTSRERGQARAETRDGIAIRRMGGPWTVYLRVMLWLLVRRRRFHAAFDCMNGIPFFSRIVLPRRTRVISIVHHVHDLQFNAYFSPPLARLGRFIESWVASRVYASCPTVTVSESSRRAMRDKLGWRAPITIVHNGGPARAQLPPTPPRTDLGSPAIVFLGRLVVQKRVTRVVDAVAELRSRYPGLRAHIVGRGPESVPLRERIDHHGLHDVVHLHGFLPEAEKNAVLAGATLHVTPSEFEGWGLTVIEAAAHGVPTVAYDVDGLRDSVRHGETGWLVRDGETLTDVVERALRELADPVRAAEIRQACRDWAAQFTWERSGCAMAHLLAAELHRTPERRGLLR
ncbi:putative glycosyltransferase [Thermobifida fusca YX]|jgi:glycosyltransferase involved in cell wall biosynthesis|uniref:Putative glycosyltransferase n=1 Tax=Thermobifida fusca (strain YX) TaxID=269800 RepID=Q47M21_THEFY|nr:putative glycosyltransferase [Thermobifida fusca YX]MBO2530459.1 glycosyltransferase family 1 protein [Thermobifida sp.]PZN60316.1 MAG: glycosyltransferase family 1 protein [Thermobifida fusca]QOS58969.1 glycosyltransferase family 4 protein [Thermobifida fusca]